MKTNWINNSSCNNCGECCMRNPSMELINEEEWKKILIFINKNYNGELHVKDFNPTINRYLTLSFKPKLEDFSFSSSSKLFCILDNDENPCPFLDFDIIEAKYYCTIQIIKPETCVNWFCEPLGSVDNEFHDCVLNYGQYLEYPLCEECQEYGIDEENPRKIGEPTECEMGEECFYLERRVRYFLRYAKNNPKQKETFKFANKLIDILKKQHEIYKNLLKSDLDLTKEEVILNLNKYSNLIADIKAVLGNI